MPKLQTMPKQVTPPRHVWERGEKIYRRACEAGLSKGRPRAFLRAASLYAACRIEEVPVTLNEVARLYGCSVKSLAKTYRALLGRLNLAPPPQRPEYFINRNRKLLGDDVAERALAIIASCNHVSKKPSAVAVAAAYIASRGRIEQNKLARYFSTTTVTIRNHVKWLETMLPNTSGGIGG